MEMECKVCRLCCKNEAASFLFLKDSSGIQLSAKIMYYTKIIIEAGDGLPSAICKECEAQVNACYQFIINCENSDKQLRSQAFALYSVVVEHLDNRGLPMELKTEISLCDEDSYHESAHSDDIPLTNLQQNATSNIIFNMSEDLTVKTVNRKSFKKKIRNRVVIKCTICGKRCINQSTLGSHMRSHSQDYLFPCSKCNKKYKDSGNLKRHFKRAHSENRTRNFMCESCGKSFFSKSDVQIHMRTHTGETPYSCTECAARFTQVGALLRHKKRHSGEKDYLCILCSKKFCTRTELTMHRAVHSAEKKFVCPICDTSFKYKSNLTKHQRRHSEPHSFICNYCGNNFNFKGNLKIHIQNKHSEKSGHCGLCSRHVTNIETHMWRHTGERPFKCELCTSTFFEAKSLVRHVNFKHTKTDKYKCEVDGCSMTFPSRPMLDFHIAKLHAKQIPFPCDRCPRGFYRKNDLARHKIGTHKERLN